MRNLFVVLACLLSVVLIGSPMTAAQADPPLPIPPHGSELLPIDPELFPSGKFEYSKYEGMYIPPGDEPVCTWAMMQTITESYQANPIPPTWPPQIFCWMPSLQVKGYIPGEGKEVSSPRPQLEEERKRRANPGYVEPTPEPNDATPMPSAPVSTAGVTADAYTSWATYEAVLRSLDLCRDFSNTYQGMPNL